MVTHRVIECEGQDHGAGLSWAFKTHQAKEAYRAWKREHYPQLPDPVVVRPLAPQYPVRGACSADCTGCGGEGDVYLYDEDTGHELPPRICSRCGGSGIDPTHYL